MAFCDCLFLFLVGFFSRLSCASYNFRLPFFCRSQRLVDFLNIPREHGCFVIVWD